MAVIRPSELFAKVEEAVGERLSRTGIAIAKDLRYDEPVIIDAERVFRALLNVADNARKAMTPSGGGPHLEGLSRRREARPRDGGHRRGHEPRSARPRLRALYSASGQGGTGLGMLIVKNIVEARRRNGPDRLEAWGRHPRASFLPVAFMRGDRLRLGPLQPKSIFALRDTVSASSGRLTPRRFAASS